MRLQFQFLLRQELFAHKYKTKMKPISYALYIVFGSLIPSAWSLAYNCSAPPNFGKFDVNSCCRIPEINLGDAPQKCMKHIDSLKKENDLDYSYPNYAHVCYPDCIYRETGSLVHDEILMENIEPFLQRSVHRRDRDIIPQIVRSFRICLNNIKSHMEAVGVKSYPMLTQGCTPYASMVFGCVNAETFLHCPAKMWKNERSCNLAKAFAEQCNPLPHVPMPIV